MEKEDLKKEMERAIKELVESLPGMKQAAQPVQLDQSSVGRLSRMDAIGAQAINKRTYETARNKLTHLKNRLTEIDGDDFGLCAECDEKIPFKRILAVPESRLCIVCTESR